MMAPNDRDLRISLSKARTSGAANSYARSGILRIGDLFTADVADALHHHLDREVEWGRVFSQGDKAWDLTPEAIAMPQGEHERAFLSRVHETARDGFQFLFDSLIVSDNGDERRARGLLVDRVIEALNHPASLDLFRTITGEPAVRTINGQATRYLPGHFLTSHDDDIDGEDRVAAYVINLTRDWRSDWGGMLQFHNSGDDIPLALKPGFNTIHLFRVPQTHSVSYVAPFASVPRYAITGWLQR